MRIVVVFPEPFGPRKPHLTRRDGELEAVERPRRAEGLHEPETEIACVMVGPSL